MTTGNTFRWLGWFIVLVLGWSSMTLAEPPKNVILMIGDGMGPEQIKAASIYASGREGALAMESFPHKAMVVTCPAYSAPAGKSLPAKVTDSAAAATAMATGQKVYNGVLSLALPDDGHALPTVLEHFAASGKMTGLVTSSYLTDATPAAFGVHTKSRGLHGEIVDDYLAKSRPNVLMGGNDDSKKGKFTTQSAEAAGYRVITDRQGLVSLPSGPSIHVLGIFGDGPMCYEFDYANKRKDDYDTIPHLSEMAAAALEIVSREPKGFFLMIEGGCIDKACHTNNLERAVYETLEFDKTVKQVMEWASHRDDTLVLVTADHETGGLKVVGNKGKGAFPKVTWTSKNHSGVNVCLYATGPGSDRISGVLDNTDLFRVMMGTFATPTQYTPPVSDSAH